MSRLVVYAGMLGVFFALGLGISAMLIRANFMGDKEEDVAAESLTLDTDGDGIDDMEVPADADVSEVGMLPEEDPSMPVALRAKPMTAEEVYRYSEIISEQQEALKHREESLKQEAQRLQVLQDDLEATKRELDGMRKEIDDAIRNGEVLRTKIAAERDALKAEEIKKADEEKPAEDSGANADDKAANIKQIAGWLQSMPAEKAAENLVEHINQGHIHDAISIVASMEQRTAAKMLGAVKDPSIVSQITEQFMSYDRPDKKKQR
ncbi:MAG: hypothetical protein KDA60_04600 [Planctomycetales bacterium]|nr:hypothetical protein [Planctomycetales bacterium]